MIPENITKTHIIKAIERIDEEGVPPNRKSKKYLLAYNGKYYPPKYVISLANKYANGRELDHFEFKGGKETNDFLRSKGFKIVEISDSSSSCSGLSNGESTVKPSHQGERCKECKRTVERLLEKIYGEVEANYKLYVGAHPEDFEGTPCYSQLKKIYEALQNYRGFKEFIKAKALPNCDFFVPNPGIIVEFDESQHFTIPRKITLENYPDGIKLGFDKGKWIKLCEKIKARDDTPLYRDEQRAWYDTLRDFLPLIKGLRPTIRLFAKDFAWCSLDPESPSDVEKFKQILEEGL